MASDLRVGCLGGGQLGRMTAQAASRLGVSFTVLDPGGLSSPAGQVCGKAIEGSFKDGAKVRELASQVDVLTVEIEHIDASALAEIEAEGRVAVHPSHFTLTTVQDKLLQKRHLASTCGAAVPLGEFVDVPDVAALLAAGKAWGYPLMLKARREAYDGRGNAVVSCADEAADAFASLSQGGKVPLYAERWCKFEKELAVMVARSAAGELKAYEVVETVQRESMCHSLLAPAQIPAAEAEAASEVAKAAIGSLTGAGIFGVELFWMGAGAEVPILLNEIAPRPHNSGHYTMDGICKTDQFEQHLRAVIGLPLGSTEMSCNAAAMLNIIGDGAIESTLAPMRLALSVPAASVHWYGKDPPKNRRKMGHINVAATSAAAASSALAMLEGKAAAPSAPSSRRPLVGVIMGSDSDLPCMQAAADVLEQFDVPYEITIVSAHRTPLRMVEYAQTAEARGLRVVIAGAGGAAHLPGMVAAMTTLPVIGVPVKSSMLSGNDSLLSIVQMPKGVPVATVAIHNAANAALLAVRMLGVADGLVRRRMGSWMAAQEAEVLGKAEKLERVGHRAYQQG